jgi:2-polyprenyl-3-methyl-5-hydroxy-6-metoxy-1,4-benzoquinol methylase
LDEASSNWTALGEADPMWVVLTDPTKKNNRWTEKEFFTTGQAQIEEVFNHLRAAGISPATGKALDFGCGVGRLTQALARRFSSVDGVDISASMLRHAEKFNRFPDRVKYHLNVRPDLATFPAEHYDFICSLISLQHTPCQFQRGYLTDFLRLLKPGGSAYFQTIHARGWRQLVPDWGADCIRKWRSRGQAFIPLYGLPVNHVRQIFDRPGSRIVKFDSTGYAGWESRYANNLFIVQKNSA